MDTRQHTKIEEELKREKKFSQNIIATIPDSLLVLDKALRVKSANRSFYSLFQTKPQKVVGSKIGEILGDEDGKLSAKLAKLFGTEDVLENFELHYQSEKLGERIFNITARGIIVAEEEEEEEEEELVVLEDITEQKRAKKALEESEEKYRSLVTNVKLGIFRSTPEPKGKFLEVNPAMEEITGYSRKKLLQMNVSDLYVHPEEREVILEEVVSARGKTTRELRFRKKDGTEITVSDTKFAVRDDAGKILHFDGIMEDITERKRLEEKLQEERNFLKNIFVSVQDGISILDNEFHIKSVNATMEQWYAHAMPLVGKKCYEAYHSRSERCEVCPTHQTLETGEATYEVVPRRGAGGEVVGWLDLYSFPFVNMATGQNMGVIEYVRDITERKQAEEALQQSEEKYRTILKEMEDSYFEVDLTGNITFANDAACRNLGYSREELLGMNYRNFTAEEDIEHVYKIFNEVYRTGEPNKGFTWKIIRKDGSIGFADASVSLLCSQGGEIIGFRGVGRDVTERKKAEEERRQMELKAQITSRLASVGEMAAGVAHEINNPLTAVTGYAQLLVDREDIPPDIRSDLAAINDGARRVAGIVQTLLSFSRQTKPQRKLVDINELIEGTLVLRAYHLRVNNIEVITRLAPGLLETVVDPGQIQQVLLNLIVNAETEMKLAHGKGKLTITTEKSHNTIKICCQDNGPGIKPEVMDKIFDPFFTTREVGQGTGLGLSLCYGIVAEHKGKIYAESKPGKGATFVIELPVVTEAKPPKPAEPVVKKPKKAVKARILVVDDEQVVRDVINRVLTGEGHKVDTVDNAADALKKIESKRYKLILVDIKMPGMNGVELYKRIQKIAKPLARKVVFITGDIMGADTEKFLSETKVAHIDKPFDAEQLSREVKRALSEGR